MSSPLRLIQPGPPHAGLLAALHAACFEAGWPAAEFDSLLRLPGAMAWLALRGDRPVGMLLARLAADEAEILTLAVLTEARRQGIARGLLNRTLEQAKAAGGAMVFLEVASANAAARRLYAGMGFTEIGRRRGYYEAADGTRADAVVMRCDLQSPVVTPRSPRPSSR